MGPLVSTESDRADVTHADRGSR